MDEYQELDIQAIAEKALEMHKAVAYSSITDIAWYKSEPYKASKALLFALIGLSWPNEDKEEIYDIWLDCGENLAYCVRQAKYDREHQ